MDRSNCSHYAGEICKRSFISMDWPTGVHIDPEAPFKSKEFENVGYCLGVDGKLF